MDEEEKIEVEIHHFLSFTLLLWILLWRQLKTYD
jgi:hypothetical protein